MISVPQVELSFLNRKSTLITMLLSLLLFQSFWNIAAAFCVHEETDQTSSVNHFGHHQATICHQDNRESGHQNSHQTDRQNLADKDLLNQQFNSMLGDDHHDHLPSYASVILIDVNHELVLPVSMETKIQPRVEWKNSYKAPYLNSLNPPPELPPL